MAARALAAIDGWIDRNQIEPKPAMAPSALRL